TGEDVSGDVTRSVTERGGYTATSGWTSGTGATQQTTETTEVTETIETTDETTEITEVSETTETTDETTEITEVSETTETQEDVSSDNNKVIGVAVGTIGAAAVIGSAVSAILSENTSADVGSTETTEVVDTTETVTTETVTSEDASAVTGEDVSGDVTRSVTERGGYTATSGWTSGTGATQQTTEATETTETTDETTEITEVSETTETQEDVSSDNNKVIGVAAGTIGAAAVIGSAVSAIRSENTSADVGSTETTEVVDTTETVTNEEVGLMRSKEFGRLCHDLVKNDSEKTLVVLGLSGSTKHGSKLRKVKDASSEWNWLSQFVRFCAKHGKSVASLEPEEARELARTFCAKNFSSFSENLYESGSLDEKRTAWNVSYALSAHFPELAVQEFGVEFGQHKRVLAISEVLHEDKKVTEAATAEVVASMLKESPRLSGGYENVLITEGGKTVFYGSVKSLRAFFQEFGSNQADDFDVTQFLLGLSSDNNAQYQVSVIDGANEEKENQRIQRLSSFVSFADDSVIITDTDLSQEVKKPNFDDNKLSQAAVSSGSTVIEGGAAIVASASVEEKASISSIGAVSASTKESAAVTAATSAASGEESSAALTKAGTAAMSSLYARYAREGSSIESMTFSADIDAAAQEIQRVCTGAASDEAALASLLLSKTAEQRYLIWWRYRILYKQSLTVWVKSTSEYGVLLKMLASPLEHVEAEILRKATKGLGTTEEWIYPVVMARSNAEIALLKKTFQEKYGDDLVKVLSGELSGDLKKVILTAMRGEVAEFNASIHTSAKAAADADALYKAGEGRMGTDETTFINILVLSPAEHVRSINAAYAAKYKTDVAGAIKTEFSGDARRALLFLVRSVLEPVDLLAELFETTLQSASKNAYGLSAWVVRYYRLLVRIRIVYMRLYRQELRTRIQSVVSGEYCQLLLSVFDAAEVEFGASASGSGSCERVGEEKASISSIGAVSASTKESAAVTAATSAASGEESSAALTKAGTAAMSSLYARYAREGSSIESMTFSADIDAAAQEIQRVCTGAASDEAALASLLLSKTAEQRYLIWWRYRILYKQSLTVWVKSTSEYGVLLKMLASPLEHVETEILRKATKGLGTTEEWIYPVVMARSNAEIALLKKTFQEKYGDDLVKVLSGELSGDLKKVILTAMRGEVAEFNASIHTSAKAAADADALYKAGEGRMGTDETTFINILVLSPAEHVRSINTAYAAKYKTDVAGAIKTEFSGDARRALLFLVRSVLEPVDLLAELFETTLQSASKNAYGLSAWVVRYYRLLVRIRIVYMRLYRQELRTRIQSVVSGEYCQLLLSVFDAAEVEFGASASGSGSVSVAAVSASGSGSVSVAAVSASSGAAVRGGAAVSGAAEGGAAIVASASVEEKASISSSVVKKTVSSSVTALSSSIVRSLRFGNLYAQSCHDVAGGATLGLYADIEAAVEEIKSSCTGALSDEKSLASILVSKTAEQSYLIWWRYRILYKQSLTVWVKSTSDYGVLLKMLASPLEHVEAEILRKATKGLGTTEEWIYPVVMARSNAEIALLKETYRELYGDDLVNVLRGELSGGLKKIIMAAMQGDVPSFDAAVHTSAKAAADADVLYKAGEGKWGTDEETFIRIVVSSPAEHLRDIDAAYSKKYKKTSIIKAIKGEFKGDAQAALLFHVRMVFEPFELLAGLFESTMKGLGTDEYGLSAAVMRYHVLLPEVKAAYKKLYGKELSQRIRGDTSGEYRDLLLAIVDGQ
ncbi:hypothetical protein PF007_g11435, partial [Phytophthora fragariae]